MSASENVVKNVRGLMGETGVTQAEVGRWLGLSQAAIAKRISTRSVVFNVDELGIIADRFGVPVQSLFDPPRAHPFRGIDRSDVTHEYVRPRCVTHGLKVAA